MRTARRQWAAWRGDSGTAAVEFAIIVPVLFMLLFGVVDLARAFGMQDRLMSAARQGARAASVQADPVGNAQAIRDLVKSAATPMGGAGLTDAEISVSADPVSKRVTVNIVNYPLSFITPFASTFGHPSINLSAQAVLPWEQAL
jgi:Flp pilus assembly protein TadG